jgi:hypothetical protein
MKKTNEIPKKIEALAAEGSKFVYVKRHGLDSLVVDIPLEHAVETLRRHPLWEIVSSDRTMRVEVEALFKDDLPEPTKPGVNWNTQCSVCQRTFKNANGLRLHSNVHKG